MRRLLLLFALVLHASCASYPDLNKRLDLERVIEEHAREGQLVLFTYTPADASAGLKSAMWRSMCVELAYELEARSTPYVVLTHTAEACDELRAASSLVHPPCVLNSVTHRTHGYNAASVETLWVARYHACALLAEAGVGCTLLDGDTVLNRDFLPLLRQYEEEYSLIVLREGGSSNGGLWHLRASDQSGAGLWIIRQIERRSTLYEKFKVHSAVDGGADPGLRMDQDILADVLRVASKAGRFGSGNASAFDFAGEYERSEHKDHEFWKRFPQEPSSGGYGWEATAETYSSPYLPASCPFPDDAAKCGRLAAFQAKWRMRDVPLEFMRIAVPFDSEHYDESAPPEKVLSAPLWLFAHGDVMAGGFDDQVAVVHLLYTDLQWHNVGQGSHVGRWVQWLARPGVHTFAMPPGTRYLALSQPLVDAASNHREVMRLKHLIKQAALTAAATNRTLVLPPFACTSPWVKVSDTNAVGVEDHRVVLAADGLCYPAPAGWNSCFPGVHFVYPFMELGEGAGARTQVLTDASADPPRTQLTEELEKLCPDFFSEVD